MHKINATSSGNGVYLCDVDSPLWGCDEANWINGNRKNCSDRGNIMSWVKRPERTGDFRLFIGNFENSIPPTEYYPGEFLTVGVVKTTYNLRFRGLLLYAQNEQGEKVGEWVLPEETPVHFHSPVSSCGDGPFVLHAGGVLKEGAQLFNFRAPAGTGTITFKALIKEGDANVGSFFWPNEQISLTESTMVSTTEYELADFGQSCTDFCVEKSMYCDPNFLYAIRYPEDITELIAPWHACELPYVSSCNNLGAHIRPSGVCAYHNGQSTCDNEGRSYSEPSCDTSDPNVQRFCLCSENEETLRTFVDVSDETSLTTRTNSDSNSATVETDEQENISSLLSVNAISMFFIMTLFSRRNLKLNLFVVLIALCLLNGANAHNWLQSNSRSLIANTAKPCPKRTSLKPHVQVGPNQDFQVEWMQGHPDQPPSYFALVKAENEYRLSEHTTEMFEQYIADALNDGAQNTALNDVEQRLHWTEIENDGSDYNVEITSGPMFLTRPSEFTAGTENAQRLWSYHTTHLQDDVRVEYQHPVYDWIISVHRFPHNFDQPNRFDTARFMIPPGEDFGDYILHWIWSGYYDCVDINYIDVPQDVEYPYGREDPDAPKTFSRIDHCYFPEIELEEYGPIGGYKRIINNDPSLCLDVCKVYETCGYVQVIPFDVPSTVRSSWVSERGFEETEVAENKYHHLLLDFANQIYEPILDMLTNEIGEYPDQYICYDLSPRIGSATEDIYIISMDPEDPTFYSTCYVLDNNKQFLGIENEEKPPIITDWKFGQSCISCEDHSRISSSDFHVPVWKLTDKCVDCDEEPGTAVQEKTIYAPIRYNASCATGQDWNNQTDGNSEWITCTNGERCHSLMGATGLRTRTSLEQCALLVKDSDMCSEYFTYLDDPDSWDGLGNCWCHMKHECCGSCSPNENIGEHLTVYEVLKSDTVVIPDNTCATGVLSDDQSACCSPECGDGECRPISGWRSPAVEGFCCSTCIPEHRTCDIYGPPCNMV